jgi:hypothetical protein
MIIGLTGLKGSGKTTVADMLHNQYGFIRRSFASPIKEMLETMGIPQKYIYDVDYKETPVPGYGKSARHMMQTLGTEWGRELVSQNIWVKAMESRINGCMRGDDVVIDDVRFPNECAMVHALKGKVILVHRPGLAPDAHASEAGVSGSDIDDEIRNSSCYLTDLEDAVTTYMEIGNHGTVYNTESKRLARI